MQRQSVKHGTSRRVNARSFTFPYFYAGNSGIICSFLQNVTLALLPQTKNKVFTLFFVFIRKQRLHLVVCVIAAAQHLRPLAIMEGMD